MNTISRTMDRLRVQALLLIISTACICLASGSITTLDLSEQNLTEFVPAPNVTGPVSEVTLIYSHNAISAVQDGDLGNTTIYYANVTVLDLSFNRITVVSSDAFKALSQIRLLNLASNNLKTLPEFIFPSVLKELNLSKNNLTHLPKWLMRQGYNSLQILDLSGTQLKALPKEIVLEATALTNLTLPDGLNLDSAKLCPVAAFLQRGVRISPEYQPAVTVSDYCTMKKANVSCYSKDNVIGYRCLCPDNTYSNGKQCVQVPNNFGELTCNSTASPVNQSCLTAADCATPWEACTRNHLCTYNNYNKYVCRCKSGYQASGSTCTDINECSVTGIASRCNNSMEGRMCTNTEGSYMCQCLPGYNMTGTGVNISCSDIDECQTWVGKCTGEHAVCKNSPGSFNCTCNSNVTGYHVVKSTLDGSFECSDINECLPTAGLCAGVGNNCTNTPGNYTCGCLEGFRDTMPVSGLNVTGIFEESGDEDLDRTRFKCYDIDECLQESPKLCIHEHASCVNSVGSYKCECSAGYQPGVLSTGEPVCENIDECNATQSPCVGRAQCCDTIGSYLCHCERGYSLMYLSGLPRGCYNIDECKALEGKKLCNEETSTCTDTEGSYACVCNTGYKFNGTSCQFDLNTGTSGEKALVNNTVLISTYSAFGAVIIVLLILWVHTLRRLQRKNFELEDGRNKAPRLSIKGNALPIRKGEQNQLLDDQCSIGTNATPAPIHREIPTYTNAQSCGITMSSYGGGSPQPADGHYLVEKERGM